MTARKKVKDLAIRQSFMTYLNDWNINPDYRELRNEWKMRMLRAEGKVCNSFCCLLHCYLVTRCPQNSSLNNILNMPLVRARMWWETAISASHGVSWGGSTGPGRPTSRRAQCLGSKPAGSFIPLHEGFFMGCLDFPSARWLQDQSCKASSDRDWEVPDSHFHCTPLAQQVAWDSQD